MSQRKYAAHRKSLGQPGGTLKAVQKAIAAGRIQLVDGLIDSDAADAAWRLNTNLTQQANAQVQVRQAAAAAVQQQNGQQRPAAPIAPRMPAIAEAEEMNDGTAAPPAIPEGPPVESFADAYRREKTAAATERELRVQKMKGLLVDLPKINAWVSGMIINVRDELDKLPAELRDELAQEADPITVEKILRDRIHQALARLAVYEPDELGEKVAA